MYLLSVRCFNNVSVVYDKSKKYENSRVIANLKMAMEHLYRKVKTSRDKYGQFLTDCENKVTEIICDRFFKTFKPDLIKSKDKFLVGVEALEYSKAEQIEFTI